MKIQELIEAKQRLDPKCWKGYKKQGTKMKGDTRVNNCVPESAEQGVAEGFDKEADAYKEKLLSTLPQMMRFYEKNVKGWKPGKEQMLGAIDTGYMVMKHTGDVKQAGKAIMDELNTLHRMNQGQQGVAEGLDADQKKARQVPATEMPKKTSPVLGKAPKQHPFKGRAVGSGL